MDDVRHTGGHANDKCKNGDDDDQQVPQTEKEEPYVSLTFVDIGKRQEVNDSW